MRAERRILIADSNFQTRSELEGHIKRFLAPVEITTANDGTEAMFKISNAYQPMVFLSEKLPKHDAFQLTEWILSNRSLETIAIVILGQVPANERFVDDIITGRVQFLPDRSDIFRREKIIARGMSFVSHGNKEEFNLRFISEGDILMEEGSAANFVYLVKKGRLKAYRHLNEQNLILAHVEVGEFVGEMAYINGDQRSANVIAESSCELIEIPVERLDYVLFQKPAWSRALMRTLTKRLKNANLHISGEN